MKEIILALKDSVESRVKNKIIGSILLSIVICNWKGILTFFLVDKPEKINMISNYHPDYYGDFFIPTLYGLFYATLFQLVIYIFTYAAELIGLVISSVSSRNTIKTLRQNKLITAAAIDADLDFQKKIILDDLTNTKEDLDKFSKDNAELKQTLTAQSDAANKIEKSLNDQITLLNAKLSKAEAVVLHLREDLNYEAVKYTHCVNLVRDAFTTLGNKFQTPLHRKMLAILDSMLKLIVDNIPPTTDLPSNKAKILNSRDGIISQINNKAAELKSIK